MSVFVSAVACGGDPTVHVGNGDFGGAGGTSSGGSGGSGTGNGPGVDIDGGNEGGDGNDDPCASDDPPEDCFNIEPSGPACGDSEINQDDEECDDGNSLPGDGCSGVCVVEDYWECPEEGEPCVLTIACGDGVVDPGEVCDDGNTKDGDGCSADCYSVDPGYYCPDEDPNEPEECLPLFECGDGAITNGEQCEDDDAVPESGDGCDEECQLEPGWECKPGQACTRIPVCGNSIIEAGENCDDGQATPASGDGCSAKCRKEPFHNCPEVGQPCVSTIVCGNGKIDPTEACDDGQAVPTDGDGCSADCKTIEEDFLCLTEGQPCIDLLKCGDGRVYGSEECDDGEDPPQPNDGCSASCTFENPAVWSCKPGQKCTLKPYCGDGIVQAGETCDDGGGMNPTGTDGCSSTCKVEPGWTCPASGGACSPPPPVVCGDGKLGAGEVCDDGNTAAGDGCAADCKTIENGGQGWDCSRVGFLCKTVCGDGYKRGKEQCDDGNPTNGDGCSSTCRIEEGHVCVPGTNGPAEVCTGFSVCGNGVKEGTEACDDGNGDWNDGCTPDCKKPLNCANGPCTSTCGDGIVLPTDPAGTCDDGNTNDGDGCSTDCKVEPGFKCELKPTPMKLPMVLRDFIGWCPTTYTKNAADSLNSACDNNTSDSIKGHPDFEIDPGNPAKQLDGTVENALDSAGKPVNKNKNVGPNFDPLTPSASNGWTSGQDYFQWWYRDNPTYNRRFNYAVTLIETPAGSNRWVYERNPFWPLDPDPPGTVDPVLDSFTNLPPIREKLQNNGTHNYYFTSETRYWFQFKPDSNPANDPVLTFYGDDDVWVFIAGKLTVDIGGIHGRAEESVTIRDNGTLFVDTCDQTGQANGNMCDAKDDYTVPGLTLENGKVYEIAVFQAERHVVDSNYQLTLQGFSLDTSVCEPQCGVDPPVVTPGEECDDGSANGPGYGKCGTDCTLNGYCGDDFTDAPQEQCDNGVNNSVYSTGGDSCAPGCVLPPYCGDGNPNAPYEECDLGNANTVHGYGGCTTTCELGPYCGDAETDLAHNELCDDGVNDGFYGTCNPDCKPAPYCGDGYVDVIWGEECDEESDTCHECKLIACGNGTVDDALGEECDDGDDNGAGYGYCTTECKFGPRCGDGILQDGEGEECDDGEDNDDNAYGGCTTECKFGPYCGDNIKQSPPETCDYGVLNDGLYGHCYSDCTPAAGCGDSVVQAAYGEQCEVGVDGATAATCKECKLGANCGNKFVDPGEECDDGKNDGGYGKCAPGCKFGPRCGDGVKNGNEQCDDGENKGGYGKCSPGCVYGPYCGDGKVTKPYEECDDGNTKNGDGCSSACKSEIAVPK